MKCPVDGTQLEIADRSGVEIDWCPQCRGVWLDRGELDKILDRQAAPIPPRTPAPPQPRYDEGRQYDEGRRYHDDDDRGRPRKRRESFLSDLFDF